MRHRRLAATLGLIGLLLVGSGCETGDLSMVVNFIDQWSRAKGLVDENGKPTAKAMQGYLFGTGEPLTDAAIGSGAATKDIRKAEKAIAASDEAADKGDFKKAEESLKEADKAHPNDWAVLNRQYALDVQAGNTGSGVQAKKQRADAACASNSDKCQLAMLKDRVRALDEVDIRVARAHEDTPAKVCAIKTELRNANAELGRKYEAMSIFEKTGGVEGSRNRAKYSDLANHYLTEAENYQHDIKTQCGTQS